MHVLARIRSWPVEKTNRIVVWSALAVIAVIYVVSHELHGARPTAESVGWDGWHDQGKYALAARAWAQGMLDPNLHWYFPGYALLGAPFVWLTPSQPFLVPNILLLIATGWLFAALAEYVAPQFRMARGIAAIVFLAVVATPWMMKSFVVPWSTTATTALMYASLLVAMRFWEAPTRRDGFLLGLFTVATILFRPTDVMLLAAVVVPFVIASLARHRRDLAMLCLSGIAGALLPLLLLGGTYLAIYGTAESMYLMESRETGFEWALLPLHWVALVISPRPLFQEKLALTAAFPWIVPGVAGMVACLVSQRGGQLARHGLVVAATTVYMVVYLAYRDLHPQGMFPFHNYHYFKPLIPLFALYALLLPTIRHRAAWVVSAVAVIALFCWRAEWHPAPPLPGDRVEGPLVLHLEDTFESVLDGVAVHAGGSLEKVYARHYRMQVGDNTYESNVDFKVHATRGGFFLTLLRPIARGYAKVTFPEGVTLDGSFAPERGRQTLVFGLPRWGR